MIPINVNYTSNMLLNWCLNAVLCCPGKAYWRATEWNDRKCQKWEDYCYLTCWQSCLSYLMWFQFKWIDNFHCVLKGLHCKSLLCVRLSHSYWKIQHNTGRNALKSFKSRPDDSATNSWPVTLLSGSLWSLSLWGCISSPVNLPEMPCKSPGDDPVCVWELADCT